MMKMVTEFIKLVALIYLVIFIVIFTVGMLYAYYTLKEEQRINELLGFASR